MMNPRILVSAVIAVIMIFGSMSWLANRAVDKALPELEKQKRKAEETQKEHADYIRQGLEEMGASEEAIQAALVPPSKEEMPELITTSPSPRKPIGTWAGVRKGDQTNMAFMKFDRSDYWMIVKGGPNGDYKEKGSYKFDFDMLHFNPDDGEAYTMEYFMATLKNIELYGNNVSLTFEKTKDIDIDF